MHATDRNTKRYLARKHFRFVTAFSIGFVLIHNECGREDIAIRQKRQAGKKETVIAFQTVGNPTP